MNRRCRQNDPGRRSVILSSTVAVLLSALAALSIHLLAAPHAQAQAMKPTDTIERWTHASGATVLLVEKHDLPMVSFQITLRSGALWDPAGKPGLARLTSDLMMRGAGQRDRAAIDEELDFLGAEVETDATQIGLSFEGDSLSRNLDAVAAILADVLQRPTFDPEELARLQREVESDILRVRDNDRELNRRFFRRALFGAHPYGRPSDGTLDGVKAVTLDDIRAFYKAHFVTGNIILGFSGDLTREQADALATTLIGQLPQGQAPKVELPSLQPPTGRQVLLVDKPDRSQNQILIGHLAPDASSDDHFALEIANTIFGGTFTARLNHEVRDQRGLSYGAYSYVTPDRFVGSFSMWTFPAATDGVKTVHLLIELFEGLRAAPLTEEEVTFARQYLLNSFAFLIDTPEKLVDEAIEAELEGRPVDHLATYLQNIEAVTVEQVNKAVQDHLDPANFLLTMLCTAAGFEEPMKALPGVTTVKVVPYDQPF